MAVKNAEQPVGKEVDSSMVRFYVDAFGDAGLYINHSIGNIVMWMGQFHIFKNFMELSYKILDNVYDVRKLASIWGFQTPSSFDYLYSCGNMKKSFDFIREGLIPAMFEALCCSFCKHCDVKNIAPTLENLHIFTANETDPTFQANVQLLFDVLLPLELLKSSMRTDSMDSFDAARLKLLPLCFALGHSTYGKRHVQEIVQLYWQVTLEVRERHREFFCFNGKGIDELMEEQNRAQIRLLADQAPTHSTMLESSLYLEYARKLSDAVARNLKASSTSASSEQVRDRTHIDQSQNVAAIAEYLMSIDAFAIVAGRSSLHNLSNTQQSANVHLQVLLGYGSEQLETWTFNYLNNVPQTFPKPAIDFGDDLNFMEIDD